MVGHEPSKLAGGLGWRDAKVDGDGHLLVREWGNVHHEGRGEGEWHVGRIRERGLKSARSKVSEKMSKRGRVKGQASEERVPEAA